MTDSDLQKFFDALERSIAEGDFVKLTLAKHRGGEADLKNVYVRLIRVKKGERLSFLYRRRTRDEVRNLPPAEGLEALRQLLGAEFLSAHLFTLREDLRLDFNRRREPRLVSGPPTFSEAPPDDHDRGKRRLIDAASSVYLRRLGVTDERGQVRPAMGDKLRQINKFVEVVAGLFDSSPLKGREEISVADVGSGKGYLTFAVYDYFTNALGLRASVTGVEARPELVELCDTVAREAGFERLKFEKGFVEDYEPGPTDLLIALHACDTATDEAIHKGIRAGASVIITAPCCHKEVRPQMRAPEPLRGVLRHGHLLEREAESVTDSLRALLLESAGYMVKVFEFVNAEHTRKNTMIAAVRREGAADADAALAQFKALKDFYGIGEQRLEKLLCELPPA
ncbi:MAG TPA: SAM-dependent methyltransferase [Pyrinomonadaceae bacterium]|nr:SAM-dependent methyltransferase [Pyrinomonadaceae bacterium]